ncbi:MAG TPA: cell division protein FtsA [Anaerolineales bacterium]|nr:cell division protein FtsA [Anaerolineales bacterium]
MEAPLLTAIDVGTTKICTLVAEMTSETDFEILGVGLEPSRGMRKGVVVNVDEAGAAIRESVAKAERSSGLEIGQALVSLAGSHIASVNSRGVVGVSSQRGIDQDDIDRALDAAQAIAIPHNREVLHVIPRGFIVDGQEGIRSPLGMHGFRLEVEAHIVTAASTSVQNLTKCVESAGVQVESYVLNPLASAEIALTDTEREMGCIVCDIGGGTTDLAIYIEGNVWHTMVLSVGGNHLTSDIAHGLRLPADVAEKIKIDHGSARAKDVDAADTFSVKPFGEEKPVQVSKADLAMIIEARIEEIFSLVLQEVKRSGYDGLLPAGIILTGGTAQLKNLRLAASDVLNLPARVAAPEDLRGLVDTIKGPQFATSVGLLKWAARETLAAARAPNRSRKPGKSSKTMDDGMNKMSDWFRRLLP